MLGMVVENNFNLCGFIIFPSIVLSLRLYEFSSGTFDTVLCRIVFRHPSVWNKTYWRGSATGAHGALAAW